MHVTFIFEFSLPQYLSAIFLFSGVPSTGNDILWHIVKYDGFVLLKKSIKKFLNGI